MTPRQNRPFLRTGARSMTNACPCKASLPPCSSRRVWKASGYSTPQRNLPPRWRQAASPIARPFSPRCWMRRPSAVLNNASRRWRASFSRQLRLAGRLNSSYRPTSISDRKGWTPTRKPCMRSYSSWRSSSVRTPLIRGRSASSLSRTAITASTSWR